MLLDALIKVLNGHLTRSEAEMLVSKMLRKRAINCGIEIDDTFATASTAIKRRATGTMTTIKLDKNFDINIHGGEQFIVRGYDEERGMYYYQLFFKEEK